MSANVNATHSTLCPRSSESLYIVTYYTKWVLLLGNTVRVSSRTAPSFCVQFKTRNNNQVKRDETILLFAKGILQIKTLYKKLALVSHDPGHIISLKTLFLSSFCVSYSTANLYCKTRNLPNTDVRNYSIDLW